MIRCLVVVALCMTLISSAFAINEHEFAPKDVIIRDVCILGGGATGTYAAISLKDKGRSILVVEREEVLGGHAKTFYLDDEHYVDYGVEGVFNNKLTRDYFNRLNVKYKVLLPSTFLTQHVNFRTGEQVSPPSGLLKTAFSALLYRVTIRKYKYLQDGLYSLPDPVPEELLRPFREFVEKSGTHGALQLIFMFTHTAGNILEMPLLYVLQLFGLPHMNAFLKGGFIAPKNGMYDLYEKASQILGSDVLYQTTVQKTDRSEGDIKIVVQTTNGARKLIKTKKLLVTFAPVLSNLEGFDLTHVESMLFQKWKWNTCYVAVVKNTGIRSGVTVMNSDPSNMPGSLPLPPFQWALQHLGVDGYLASKIVGDQDLTEDQAKELLLSDIRRMGYERAMNGSEPEIVSFGSHSPEVLSVSNADIMDGFYHKLYSIQGTKDTFYSGLAFGSDYSALLWAYTETVVLKMLSSF
ncbi:uncharacterized protein N7496_010785 [Penicillium cataractarum]|uniref:Amine oxidase domain-containing protein n=1 Tax=Penicillium cataractarum TaxID=2100454 RepID=A0A9W9RDQ7_9EURO|nr:uncharacterized protein N7496_010785 [Penicillium cataractarum]KAJ5358372.1 hypothetical protein N7496_010785 [Penicillium cataractarum]